MTDNHDKLIDSKHIRRIAMLSIHSSPVGELGTRDTGGMSVYIQELSKALSKNGISTDVFTLCQGLYKDQSPAPITSLFKNVRLIKLNVKTDQKITKENLFNYLPEVFEAFNHTIDREKLSYNLIHSHYWLSAVLGDRITEMRGIPHIITFHTLGKVKNQVCPQESEPDVRIQHEKKLTEKCSRIIASTNNEKNDLISLYNAVAEKVSVVQAGVDLELFKPLKKDSARKKIGFNDSAHLLLYVGRNVPVKGLDRLLKTMPAINLKTLGSQRLQKQFRLLIIGGDDESQNLVSMIHDLNIQKDVELVGRIDHKAMPVYYNAADILVVPSYHESFCLAGIESLACGTQVVCTPVGVMPEVINDTNGCMLMEGSNKEMAESIIRAANKQRIKSPGTMDIRKSVLDYSWANTAKLMLKEYNKILTH